MSYHTQMEAARQGVLTPQMEQVLADEAISREALLSRVAEGQIVIPANIKHHNVKGTGIGAGLKTKVNVNLGVSKDCCQLDMEIQKVKDALALEADAIMDLSTFGNTREFRRQVVAMSPAIIGTVPVYDTVAGSDVPLVDIAVDAFFETVIRHAEDGVDFMTIHAGLNRTALARIRKNPRYYCYAGVTG